MCEPPRKEGQTLGSGNVDDIAIVGLALRFPGDATSPQKLWDVLERKESQWSEFPKDRLNIDGYYHPSNQRLGSVCSHPGSLCVSETVLTCRSFHFEEVIF